MEGVPICSIASTSLEEYQKLVGAITEKDDVVLTSDKGSYKWNFETKYYTCTIEFQHITHDREATIPTSEAFILMFSPDNVDKWVSSKDFWQSKVEPLDPSVRLLVCQSCTEQSDVPRSNVQKWCLENEFELVELDAEVDEDDEFDVDGTKRILQVLHAHTWSNLVMKETPDTVSPYMKQLMEEARAECDGEIPAAGACSNGVGNIDVCSELGLYPLSAHSMGFQTILVGGSITYLPRMGLQQSENLRLRLNGMKPEELTKALHEEGEEGVESFEKLFSKLQLMKERADGLSPDQRKLYAEQVALSFWNAIGGSSDEDEN